MILFSLSALYLAEPMRIMELPLIEVKAIKIVHPIQRYLSVLSFTPKIVMFEESVKFAANSIINLGYLYVSQGTIETINAFS